MVTAKPTIAELESILNKPDDRQVWIHPDGSVRDSPPEPLAAWYDAPPVPGLYYFETCDQWGNPRPGLFLWEDGKPLVMPQKPDETPDPAKFFGPIVGAMRPWETVPADVMR